MYAAPYPILRPQTANKVVTQSLCIACLICCASSIVCIILSYIKATPEAGEVVILGVYYCCKIILIWTTLTESCGIRAHSVGETCDDCCEFIIIASFLLFDVLGHGFYAYEITEADFKQYAVLVISKALEVIFSTYVLGYRAFKPVCERSSRPQMVFVMPQESFYPMGFATPQAAPKVQKPFETPREENDKKVQYTLVPTPEFVSAGYPQL